MKLYCYTAQWCSSCPAAKKLLTESKLDVEYIDVDANSEMVKLHNIRGIPTLVVEDEEGILLFSLTGSKITKDAIEQLKEENK